MTTLQTSRPAHTITIPTGSDATPQAPAPVGSNVSLHGGGRIDRGPKLATVEIVIPVYNEQKDLEASVRRLDAYLSATFPWRYRITIADNASTDHTWQIAQRLIRELPHVQASHLDQKGRGRALKRVWLASDADVVAYMDVDLSTDLKAFAPLVAPLISGHSDIAIGSRLARGSHVVRGPKREFISRTYNLILKTAMRASFSDAQCGFKAIRTDVARELLPVIEDNNWFFDTEMLVVAQRVGLRIHEVPVDWVDDPNSTVHIVSTATEDLKGCWRVTRDTMSGRTPVRELRSRLLGEGVPAAGSNALFGQLMRFAVIGVASTIAYFVLFWMLRGSMGAQAANLVALVTTAIANTAANRALTFRVHGREKLLQDHLGGLLAFGIGLALSSGGLWLLTLGGRPASGLVETGALVVANVLATIIRFVLLRGMLGRRGAD